MIKAQRAIETVTAALLACGSEQDRSGLWRCPVPGHGKGRGDRSPSFAVREASDGHVSVKCFAGCDRSVVLDALGLEWTELYSNVITAPFGGRSLPPPPPDRTPHPQEVEAASWAQAMWGESQSASDTLASVYLNVRGYSGEIPESIRFLKSRKHRPSGQRFPVVVSAVRVWPSREVVAVHRTFLALDGRGKAPVQKAKMALGPIRGGAVQLSPLGEQLAVTEGIESGLSVLQATGLPTWAALSAGGITSLRLPPVEMVPQLVICSDHDQTGLKAAREAAKRWHAEGRLVRIAIPPEPGMDFNDLACRGETTEMEGRR